MTIANVDLGFTFDQWRNTTNQLIVRANAIDEGNLIRFVSNTNAIFISANAVRGNIIYVSANVSTSANDVSTANLVSAYLANSINEFVISNFNKTNSSFAQANSGVDAGQASFSASNVAHAKANTALSSATAADAKATASQAAAESSFTAVNVAYAAANTTRTWTQSAFGQSNLAYALANTSNITSDRAFGQANLAFALANTANITADVGFAQANLALARANTANIRGDFAFSQANLAFARANAANITADVAFNQANLAFARANAANITADVGFGQANLAFARANTANVTADNAFLRANVANLTANQAYANGANAVLYPIGSAAVTDANIVVYSGTTGRLIKDGSRTLPSGTIVGTTDTQTLTNKTLQGVRDVRVAVAASNIDLSLGNYFTRTISGTTTLTVTNVAPAGSVSSFVLELTNAGVAAITFPVSTKWAGGSQPTWTVSGKDIVGFYTHDGGTTWNAIVMGLDVK